MATRVYRLYFKIDLIYNYVAFLVLTNQTKMGITVQKTQKILPLDLKMSLFLQWVYESWKKNLAIVKSVTNSLVSVCAKVNWLNVTKSAVFIFWRLPLRFLWGSFRVPRGFLGFLIVLHGSSRAHKVPQGSSWFPKVSSSFLSEHSWTQAYQMQISLPFHV